METLPAERAVQNMQTKHNAVKAAMDEEIQLLNDVKAGVKAGASSVRTLVDQVKLVNDLKSQGTPRVTYIRVKADLDAFTKNKPLEFEVWAEWNGTEIKSRVEWTPAMSALDLYLLIAQKLLGAEREIEGAGV